MKEDKIKEFIDKINKIFSDDTVSKYVNITRLTDEKNNNLPSVEYAEFWLTPELGVLSYEEDGLIRNILKFYDGEIPYTDKFGNKKVIKYDGTGKSLVEFYEDNDLVNRLELENRISKCYLSKEDFLLELVSSFNSTSGDEAKTFDLKLTPEYLKKYFGSGDGINFGKDNPLFDLVDTSFLTRTLYDYFEANFSNDLEKAYNKVMEELGKIKGVYILEPDTEEHRGYDPEFFSDLELDGTTPSYDLAQIYENRLKKVKFDYDHKLGIYDNPNFSFEYLERIDSYFGKKTSLPRYYDFVDFNKLAEGTKKEYSTYVYSLEEISKVLFEEDEPMPWNHEKDAELLNRFVRHNRQHVEPVNLPTDIDVFLKNVYENGYEVPKHQYSYNGKKGRRI